MLGWAVIVAVLTFVALLPAFLGLFVVLPLLGHGIWHLYRQIVAAGTREESAGLDRQQDGATAT